jgi:hypothetical protein
MIATTSMSIETRFDMTVRLAIAIMIRIATTGRDKQNARMARR